MTPRHFLLVALLSTFALPVGAGVLACDTDLEAAGYCVTGERVFTWDSPASKMDELADLLAAEQLDWIDPKIHGFLHIAFSRRVECTAADVALGICRAHDLVNDPPRSAIHIRLTDDDANKFADWIRPDRWDQVECVDSGTIVMPAVSLPAGVPVPGWANALVLDPVGDGDCSPGEVIDNPRRRRAWTYRYIRNQLRRAVLVSRHSAAVGTAIAGLDTDVDIGD